MNTSYGIVDHRRLYLKVATISNKKLLVGRRSSLRGCRPGPEYGQQKIGPFANAGYLPAQNVQRVLAARQRSGEGAECILGRNQELAGLAAQQCRQRSITVQFTAILSEKPINRPGIASEQIK